MSKSIGKQASAEKMDVTSKKLEDLPNLSDTEESDSEEEKDQNRIDALNEDELNKELVTWAGRLELESLDMREKASVLTSQMSENSHCIKATAQELKKELKEWKQSSIKTLDGASKSFSKATRTFLNATKVLSTIKPDKSGFNKDIQKILEALESTQNSIQNLSNSKKVLESNAVGNEAAHTLLSRKIQTVINGIQKLSANNTTVEETLKQNSKCSNTLNDSVTKCLRRVEDIQNLQIDLNKELRLLAKGQATLSTELYKLKSDLLITRRTDQENPHIQHTPNSSFNDSLESFANHEIPLMTFKNPSQFKSQPQVTYKQSSTVPTKVSGNAEGLESSIKPPSTITYRTRSNKSFIDNKELSLDQIKIPPRNRTRKRKALNDMNIQCNSVYSKNQKTQLPVDHEVVISLLSDDQCHHYQPTLSDL